MLDSQATSAAIYKQLFTDSEWDAISSAMGDYSDYGNEEAMIADSIQAKIAAIYRLTSNWIMNTKVAKHLSIPENRINYSFYFLDNFGYEFVDYKKCYDAIAKWSDKLDTSESHFWWTQQPQRIQFKSQNRMGLHHFWRRCPHVQQHIRGSNHRTQSYQNG